MQSAKKRRILVVGVVVMWLHPASGFAAGLGDVTSAADRDHYGSAYAGSYLDPSGELVVLGTDPSTSVAARGLFKRSGADSYRRVRWNADVLTRSYQLASNLAARIAGSAVGVSPKDNRVVVHLPANLVTGDSKAVEVSVNQLPGVTVVRDEAIVNQPGGSDEEADYFAVTSDGCGRSKYCNLPLRGGIGLNNSANDSVCTAGFVVSGGGRRYILTAGHCGARSYRTKNASGSTRAVGTASSSQMVDNSADDGGVIPVSDSSRGVIFVTANSDIGVSRNATYPVRRVGTTSQGMRVCHVGRAIRQTQCGTVLEYPATVSGTGGLVRTSYCSGPGSSGGPVFASGSALGVHIAGPEDGCGGYYQRIQALLNRFGVSLVTE